MVHTFTVNIYSCNNTYQTKTILKVTYNKRGHNKHYILLLTLFPPTPSPHQVDLNLNSGIFITMNPAGKGYGGRQKLPDNLKQLFRPVAMSKPDNELIAEVILFSEGFKEAKAIGRKLVAIFSLAK